MVKPKPIKRKKSNIGRRVRAKGNKKRSSYDYSAARDVIGDPSANHAQILSHAIESGPNPPEPKSPLKKELKAMLKEKDEELKEKLMLKDEELEEKDEHIKKRENEIKERDNEIKEKSDEVCDLLLENADLKKKVVQQDKKVHSLKQQNKDLSRALQEEKKKSRDAIAKLLSDAEEVIAEANDIKFDSASKMSAAELALYKEKEKKEHAIQKEREYASYHEAVLKQKHKREMSKLGSEYESAMEKTRMDHEKKLDQWKQKLTNAKAKANMEKEMWRSKLDLLNQELIATKDRAYLEKAKRRTQVQQQIDETDRVEMLLENYIESLEEENSEMRKELKAAISDKREAVRKSERDRKLAKDRLDKWHTEKYACRLAEDYAAEQEKIVKAMQETIDSYKSMIESSEETKRRLKKEWLDEDDAHRRGGQRRWPIWVVQLICELLITGTSPSAIPANIQILYETLYGETPEDGVPSVNFVRGCRVVVQVVGETLAAMKLASDENWKQLFTDATTRRQIPFTALIIGLLGDENKIDPVVVSSCIFMEDERSETQADGIFKKMEVLRQRLTRLGDVISSKYPDKAHLVPSRDGIDMDNLGKGGVIMTDTCNAAQKLRRILVSEIDGAYDLDCMNHLRNVWFGSMEKALSKYLNDILRSSLDEIDPTLRVSASISALIRAVDKEFSLSANYPKGHGELFLEWLREYHPGVLLMHVERAAGSRQDLCTEGCLAIYMNYPYYVQFLDDTLRKYRTNKQGTSILQQNLFVVLTSTEMIALARLLSILHISICVPFRYLAGKTHEFAKYNWGAADMSRVIHTLYQKLKSIEKDPSLVLDPLFMMGIFKEYHVQLPEFASYWNFLFKEKQMKVVARKDGSKVVHYSILREHLFAPTREVDIETTSHLTDYVPVAINTLQKELIDEKKATFKYLPMFKTPYSYEHSSEERKKSLLGVRATNDEAESILGGTTSNIQRFGRISLSGAGAVSDLKRNAFFHRPTTSKNDRKSLGFFHEQDEAVKDAIFLVGIEDARSTHEANTEALERLNQVRREKEELAKQKNLENAHEDYIEALYYIRMWDSAACWKGDPRNVTKELAKLPSNAAKVHALKENIHIRVKGFGRDWCKHAWSRNGVPYSVDVLAKHLQWIIKKEKKEIVPSEPPFNVPKRISLPVLGTQTSNVAKLDESYVTNVDELKRKAEKTRRARESKGQGSMYSQLQPFSRPDINELFGKRIDVLCSVDIDKNRKALRWCQGEVVDVLTNAKSPTVKVKWDATPDIEGFEEESESLQVLLPSKWNKDNKDGAWRMDIEIDIESDDEDEEEEEKEVDNISDDDQEG